MVALTVGLGRHEHAIDDIKAPNSGLRDSQSDYQEPEGWSHRGTGGILEAQFVRSERVQAGSTVIGTGVFGSLSQV
ncbi:hypothetical protein WG66_002618 [Moniliophthora roreri]|nr:hypothetical protein WG66_002618 [Moniliophthora roreri]